jgi:hypothetical protein
MRCRNRFACRLTILAGLLAAAVAPLSAHAQGWGTLEGRVTSAEDQGPVPGASVLVAGTNFGTAAGGDGAYELSIPEGEYVIRITALGYEAHVDTVVLRRDETIRLNAALERSVEEIEELTVRDSTVVRDAGVYELDPEDVRDMPSPINDALRALKVLPGVATNSELSNQYSVRGGGFNENLIFVNGFEVFLPFRPRQGEQEGLSLVNPGLAEQVTFYTGGFPPRYGGKLSSALDVQYVTPRDQELHGSAYASLMGAGATVSGGALDGRLGTALSVRSASNGRLFGTQELEGDYRADFNDVQGLLNFKLADGHRLQTLGMWADYDYRLKPDNRRSYFGIVSLNPELSDTDLKSLQTSYDDDSFERDGYETRFGGVRLENRLSSRLRIEHDLAYFQTIETEELFVSGASTLTQVNQGGTPIRRIESGTQTDAADNRVSVRSLTGKGRYRYIAGRHAAETGWSLRRFRFEDRLREKTVLKNAEVFNVDGTLDTTYQRTVVDSLYDDARLNATKAGAYVQDATSFLNDRFVLTAGVRADYFSFNDEWTASPRLSARYELTDRTTLMGSVGLYHQAPTYREFRGQTQAVANIDSNLNRNLEAQRSLQFVLGGEHFVPSKRLYLRAEAYYKDLSNLISYSIENARVEYSGENDSEGYAYGLDLQVRGELVPGLESWFNYSYLHTEERFLPEYRNSNLWGNKTWGEDNWIPRPTDQRHTFSAFLQDYIPDNKSWKLHMRMLFGSGLPYTPPNPGYNCTNSVRGSCVDSVQIQKPGPRMKGRFLRYARMDFGVGKKITLSEDFAGHDLVLQLTGEVLNVFDMTNVVAYTWTSDFQRVPTRLTPRTFNVRARLRF